MTQENSDLIPKFKSHTDPQVLVLLMTQRLFSQEPKARLDLRIPNKSHKGT